VLQEVLRQAVDLTGGRHIHDVLGRQARALLLRESLAWFCGRLESTL
jgi:hypothetical protein